MVHEKILHLLMVSSDLAWFSHEHPELQTDGTFVLKTSFPHGGEFTLYHDFTPSGVGMQGGAGRAERGRPRGGARAARGEPGAKANDRRLHLRALGRLADPLAPDAEPNFPRDARRQAGDRPRAVPRRDGAPDRGERGSQTIRPQPPDRAAERRADAAWRPRGGLRRALPVPGLYKAWGQFNTKEKC